MVDWLLTDGLGVKQINLYWIGERQLLLLLIFNFWIYTLRAATSLPIHVESLKQKIHGF